MHLSGHQLSVISTFMHCICTSPVIHLWAPFRDFDQTPWLPYHLVSAARFHSIWFMTMIYVIFRYKWVGWEQWWVWTKLHQQYGELLMHVWRWIHPKWWWTPVWWWVDTFLYTTFIVWNLTKSIVTGLQLLWSQGTILVSSILVQEDYHLKLAYPFLMLLLVCLFWICVCVYVVIMSKEQSSWFTKAVSETHINKKPIALMETQLECL